MTIRCIELEVKESILSNKKIKKSVLNSKFNQMHDEPIQYTCGTYVLSAEIYTKKEAIKIFDAFSVYDDKKDKIEKDGIKFCFGEEYDIPREPRWWLGKDGRNSKEVWTLR